jgi:hypothetical protein
MDSLLNFFQRSNRLLIQVRGGGHGEGEEGREGLERGGMERLEN